MHYEDFVSIWSSLSYVLFLWYNFQYMLNISEEYIYIYIYIHSKINIKYLFYHPLHHIYFVIPFNNISHRHPYYSRCESLFIHLPILPCAFITFKSFLGMLSQILIISCYGLYTMGVVYIGIKHEYKYLFQ